MKINSSFHHITKGLLAGWTVLAGALMLNGLALWLGLPSWYNILTGGQLAIISMIDYTWLLIGYPLGLGSLVWVAVRVVVWYNHALTTKKKSSQK